MIVFDAVKHLVLCRPSKGRAALDEPASSPICRRADLVATTSDRSVLVLNGVDPSVVG